MEKSEIVITSVMAFGGQSVTVSVVNCNTESAIFLLEYAKREIMKRKKTEY